MNSPQVGKLAPTGTLKAKVIRRQLPGRTWKLRNAMRWSYIWGWLVTLLAKGFSKLTGVLTVTSELSAVLITKEGRRIDLGVVSRRVITTAAVNFLVDDMDNSATDITTFNYHACGTGNTAEAVGDTALVAEATTITDRGTGTKTQPSANVLQTQATQSFTNTGAIVEHGIFSVVTESTGTLWDRSVFAAINVINGDSIQWTYQVTFSAGG